MKDIKSLYLTAKSSGRQQDVDAYAEHVRDLLENNPIGYMSGIEYIISSNIGLATFKEFVERNGLSIAAYDTVMEQLEAGIKKCKHQGRSDASYQEAVTFLENFSKKYSNCFIMYEALQEKMPKGYLEAYYKPHRASFRGQDHRIMNFSGMMNRYGEAAIPDLLIFAESIGTLDSFLEHLALPSPFSNPTHYQWIWEAMSDFSINSPNPIYERSLQGINDRIQFRKNQLIREAALTHNDNLIMEYSTDELRAMEDIISFKEYKMTCLNDTDEIMALQKEIYAHYESMEELIEENESSAALMQDMLAPSKPGISSMGKTVKPGFEVGDTGMVNTRDKYTGQAADYLKKNHAGASYGEDETDSPKSKDPSLDDFKRPSADKGSNKPISDEPEELGSTIENLAQRMADAKTPAEKEKLAQNVYLFNYTNSFNKSDSSVNKRTNSDDISINSISTKTESQQETFESQAIRKEIAALQKSIDDDQKRVNDKSVRSDIRSELRKDIIYDEKKLRDLKAKLKGMGLSEAMETPWELDTSFMNPPDIFQEGFKDALGKLGTAAKKVLQRFAGFFKAKMSLANLQKMDLPSNFKKKIPLTLPGTTIVLGSDPRKQESVDFMEFFDQDSILEDLFTEGTYITEDAEFVGLSKNDVKNIINRLRSKFKAEILFIHRDSPAAALVGPAAVISTTRAKIKEITAGKSFDSMPNMLSDDTSGHEQVIFVNPSVIAAFNIRTPGALEMIISHEYGHVLTFSKLSKDDWAEYMSKVQMVGGLVQCLYPGDVQAMAEMQLHYWKLKPEALANEAVGLTGDMMLKALFNTTNQNRIASLNMEKIVALKFPAVVINSAKKSAIGIMPEQNEVLEIIRFSKQFYTEMISDQKKLKELLALIDQQEEMIKGMYKEDGSSSFQSESSISPGTLYEAKGDATGSDKPTAGQADDNKPTSDSPIRDTFMDIDRKLTDTQQKAKKIVQGGAQTVQAITKPPRRAMQWVGNMINQWKDADENKIKERMAEPHTRSNLFKAIKTSIIAGSLFKAGLLLNPIFLFLSITRGLGKNKREFRLRSEIISELKTEMEIVDVKIQDAAAKGDNKAKYQLMRFKNELNKKLIRVGAGGSKSGQKVANMI